MTHETFPFFPGLFPLRKVSVSLPLSLYHRWSGIHSSATLAYFVPWNNLIVSFPSVPNFFSSVLRFSTVSGKAKKGCKAVYPIVWDFCWRSIYFWHRRVLNALRVLKNPSLFSSSLKLHTVFELQKAFSERDERLLAPLPRGVIPQKGVHSNAHISGVYVDVKEQRDG